MSNMTHGSVIVGLYNKDEVMLRDYFAAKAMQGLLAYGWKKEEEVAPKAYAMADAMLKEREIENDPTKR